METQHDSAVREAHLAIMREELAHRAHETAQRIAQRVRKVLQESEKSTDQPATPTCPNSN